jgi:hypothetical protein
MIQDETQLCCGDKRELNYGYRIFNPISIRDGHSVNAHSTTFLQRQQFRVNLRQEQLTRFDYESAALTLRRFACVKIGQ